MKIRFNLFKRQNPKDNFLYRKEKISDKWKYQGKPSIIIGFANPPLKYKLRKPQYWEDSSHSFQKKSMNGFPLKNLWKKREVKLIKYSYAPKLV